MFNLEEAQGDTLLHNHLKGGGTKVELPISLGNSDRVGSHGFKLCQERFMLDIRKKKNSRDVQM